MGWGFELETSGYPTPHKTFNKTKIGGAKAKIIGASGMSTIATIK